jgi:ribonuclease P protein component
MYCADAVRKDERNSLLQRQNKPMLSKQTRASSSDIATIFTSAKPTGTPFFVARYNKSAYLEAHFAVIAPKNIANKAVLRNSLRRKWYAALRIALQNKPITQGLLVLILTKAAIPLTLPERTKAIEAYLTKLI